MIKDHLGNEYKTVAEMCRKYNANRSLFYQRIKNGLSLEEALTKNRSVIDHKGITYPDKKTMCDAYNINSETFTAHIKKGWTIEEALEPSKHVVNRGKECRDHLGNIYTSRQALCDTYGITTDTYYTRRREGLSIKEALTKPQRSDWIREKDKKVSNCGLEATVIEVSKNKIKIQFEDGTKSETSKTSWNSNRFAHPNLSLKHGGKYRSFNVTQGFKTDIGTFFSCECIVCGLKDLLTPQQMIEHAQTHESEEKND